MGKKVTVVVLSIMMIFIMLTGTACTNSRTAYGYEALKSAVKDTLKVKSYTGNVSLVLEDNGRPIMETIATIKASCENGYKSSMSSIIKAEDRVSNVVIYEKDGKTIIKDGRRKTYRVIKRNEWEEERCHRVKGEYWDIRGKLFFEEPLDVLLGQYKNYFIYSNGPNDIGKVSLHLSGDQIPGVLNTLVSINLKNMNTEHDKEYLEEYYNLEYLNPNLIESMLQLRHDIKVDSLDMVVDISNNNLINSLAVDIAVSGKEFDGSEHKLSLTLDIVFSGFNSTVPDTIDFK